MELSDLQWWGWLILVVPIALLLGAAVWLLWLGRRPILPKGRTQIATRGAYKVHVVSASVETVDMTTTSKRASLAVWAAAMAWQRSRNDGAHKEIKEVVVLLVDDDYFQAQSFTELRTAAAFLIHANSHVGSGIPMAVMRANIRKELWETGEPVIHEMLHAMLGEFSEPDKDRDHSDYETWEANSDDESIQHWAQMLFKRYA